MKTRKKLFIIAMSGMIALLGSSNLVASDITSENMDDFRMERMIDLNSSNITNFNYNSITSNSEFIPFVKKEGNYLKVNFLNANQEDVKFIIEDNNYLYLEKTFSSDKSFEKIFDISNLPKSYSTTAKMIVGDNTYYHFIET